jgi:hypothetical protein
MEPSSNRDGSLKAVPARRLIRQHMCVDPTLRQAAPFARFTRLYATRRSLSSLVSQTLMRFQLANVRVTITCRRRNH